MFEKLKKIIKKVSPGINTETLTPETKLIDDLAFDSLSIMHMSMEIEEEFGFRFDEAVRFETVGDVIRYLESK